MKKNESVFDFPCEFPIKALGSTIPEFDTTVIEIIRKHGPAIIDEAIKSRLSRNGRYVAVTVTIIATSQQQLDAIYQDLSNCQQVLMAL